MTEQVEWYYMDSLNAQRGPVYEQEMRQLFLNGEIIPQTLVWTEAFVAGWTTVASQECNCRLNLMTASL